MRIKLSREQIRGLSLLVTSGLEVMPVENMADRLILELMEKLSEKLKNKADKVLLDPKQAKSISLNKVESMTFYIWYHQVVAYLEVNYGYECHVGQKVFNQIDKEYA